ncbi:MAG: hypothetical protein KatS3mg114_1046 [Planctomycetaceae bacterium]|nr:MAG: hypothetical protein KatS3mg114_1046 [Planctomycetaceae bacterium]
MIYPLSLKAIKSERRFEITWNDGRQTHPTFFDVRGACPCAVCLHELTGERLLQPEMIPADIAPVELSYAGNYGIRIVWSDGHASGIYTWECLLAVPTSSSTSAHHDSA